MTNYVSCGRKNRHSQVLTQMLKFWAQTACCFEWARWGAVKTNHCCNTTGNERTTRGSCHLKHLELWPLLPTESAQPLREMAHTYQNYSIVSVVTSNTRHQVTPQTYSSIWKQDSTHSHHRVAPDWQIQCASEWHLPDSQEQPSTSADTCVIIGTKPSQHHTRIIHPFYSSTNWITKSLTNLNLNQQKLYYIIRYCVTVK